MCKKSTKEIAKAIKILGGQEGLADVCGLKQPSIWAWVHGRVKVNPIYVPLIVKATKGKCKAHLLRPDLPDLFPHPEH